MRLIDADVLKHNMEFICMGIMAGTDPYNAPLTEIDNAPTVERPHGEWGEWNEDKGYPCSNCGEYLPYSEEYDYQTNFCPNCGADMRGKDELSLDSYSWVETDPYINDIGADFDGW